MKLLWLLLAAIPNPNTGNSSGNANNPTSGIPPGTAIVTSAKFGNCVATTNSSVDCLSAFNAAIASFGPSGVNPPASDLYVPLPTTPGAYYYLSGPLHITRTMHLIGQGGTGSNQFSARPRMVWPAGSNGIVVDFADSASVNGIGAEIDHLSLTSSYAAEWQASHSYAAGTIVIPRDRTGYVYVSGSGTHSSASTEPTWNTTIGGTTSDGAVTWTTTVSSAVQMLGLASVHDCSIGSWSGNGIHIEASVPTANSNSWRVFNNFIQLNAGSGVFVSGTDVNGGYTLGNIFDANDAWGLYDYSFLGNLHSGNEISGNGVSYLASGANGAGLWGHSTVYPSGIRVLPTVKNGYVFANLGSSGTSGLSEPSWTSTIGTTVADGSITWTCFAKYNGGAASLGQSIGVNTSNAIGNYVEGSEYPVFLGEGTIWISGPNPAGIDTTSTGFADDGAIKPPVSFVHSSDDPTYNVTTIVGDSGHDLSFIEFDVVNKINAVSTQENIQYDSAGYIDFINGLYSGYRSIRIPTANTSGGAATPVIFPNGFEVSAASIIGDASTGQIHDVNDPSGPQDVATKNYVDNSATTGIRSFGAVGAVPNNNGASVSGSVATLQPSDGTHQGVGFDTGWRIPVISCTTGALAANTFTNNGGPGDLITSNANVAINPQDGNTLSVGNRILVKDESTTSHDGIYTVTQVGDGTHPFILTRASDMSTAGQQSIGVQVLCAGGTTLGGSVYEYPGSGAGGAWFAAAPTATNITIGTLPQAQGGTGATTQTLAFAAFFKTIATTLGDLVYGGASGTPTRLAGDTSNTRKFLREVSSAGVAAAPAWDTLTVADLPNSSVGTALTAAANAVQSGCLALTKTYNVIGTSTSTNNSVCLPTPSAGSTAYISLSAAIANAVHVFPASGHSINDGSANAEWLGSLAGGFASYTTAGAFKRTMFCYGTTSTNWNCVDQPFFATGFSQGAISNTASGTGIVGEMMTISLAKASSKGITTATGCNLTATTCPASGGTQSVTLTPGDWDCQAMAGFAAAASTSITEIALGISTTTNTMPGTTVLANPSSSTGQVELIQQTAAMVIGANDTTISIPSYEVLVGSGTTTTLFPVAFAAFTVSTLNVYGSMQCRRMR